MGRVAFSHTDAKKSSRANNIRQHELFLEKNHYNLIRLLVKKWAKQIPTLCRIKGNDTEYSKIWLLLLMLNLYTILAENECCNAIAS